MRHVSTRDYSDYCGEMQSLAVWDWRAADQAASLIDSIFAATPSNLSKLGEHGHSKGSIGRPISNSNSVKRQTLAKRVIGLG